MGAWATEIQQFTDNLVTLNTTKTQLDGIVTFFTNLPAGTTKEELSTALTNSTNRNDSEFPNARDEEVESYDTWDADQAAVDAHIAARLTKFTTAQTEINTEIARVTAQKVEVEEKEAGTHAQSNHQPL
jgi:hypothetical protein